MEVEDIELVDPTLAVVVVVVVVVGAALDEDVEGEEADPVLAPNCCCCCSCGGNCCCCPLVNTESSSYIVKVCTVPHNICTCSNISELYSRQYPDLVAKINIVELLIACFNDYVFILHNH